ncbi:sigma-54 dependent transcriptional regulator [Hydrogenophilus islandicus]
MAHAESLLGLLVVDDEVRSLEAIERTVEEEFQVFTASDAAEARAVLSEWGERAPIAIVLCDQRMPGVSGVEFLKEVRERWPEMIRIILSGYTDTEAIIAGINDAGIWQYLLKPWQPEQLLLVLRRAAQHWCLLREHDRLSQELRLASPYLTEQVAQKRASARRRLGSEAILCAEQSPMASIRQYIERLAVYDFPVLITGESGVGKEMVARALHYSSPRQHAPFVTQNCGALPDTLLESELFGYRKGAFTGANEDRAGLFQQADGGTLFLDEIGDTSPAFQVKLLRVLQEGEFRPLGGSRTIRVNVRVVAATNRNLEEEVRAGRFREDLFYRLATFSLHVPPLRERVADIPVLVDHLVKEAEQTLKKPLKGLTASCLEELCRYPWPGNVRELANEVLRLAVLSENGWLHERDLSPRVRSATASVAKGPVEVESIPISSGSTLRARLDAVERRIISETLAAHRGNLSKTARTLGLSRLGLRNKLVRLGLPVNGESDER